MTTALPEYRVITCPGVGEAASPDGTPLGMFGVLAAQLPPARFEVHQFDWHNAYGPIPLQLGSITAQSYAANISAGVSAVVREVQAAKAAYPGQKIILAGYSGGAQLVSQAAPALVGLIAAVITIANPLRAAGDPMAPGAVGPIPPGSGAAGQHGYFPMPHYDLANPVDPIPCCDPISPIRTFFGVTEYFSLLDPVAWAHGVYTELCSAAPRVELASVLHSDVRAWLDAAVGINAFLFGGAHTDAYLTLLPGFARTIQTRLPPI